MNILEIKDVTYNYSNSREKVLSSVNQKFELGQFYALITGLLQRGWKHFHCWQHIRKPGSAGRHFSTNLRTGFRLSSILQSARSVVTSD